MTINTHYETKNGVKRKVIDDKFGEELGFFDFIANDSIFDDSYYDSAEVIYVKDFGAKGDGIKNDSSAIRKALTALKHLPKGSTLFFEPYTTYYISSGKYALDLKDLDGVNICGNNTTILVKPIMSFCRIENCSDIIIKGLTFDYRIKPFVLSEVISANNDGIIRIKTEKSLNIRGTYKQPVADYFGLVDKKDGKYPIGITTYKVVNSGENIYDVKCNNIFEDRDLKIMMLKDKGRKFIVPMPQVGQVIEYAVSITGNKNITIIDCEVCCAANVMFYVQGNDGFIYFKNLIAGFSDEADFDVPIICWRDGFYCRDNRAAIVWEDCEVKSLCDDALNMSASHLSVQQLGGNRISLYLQESVLPYADIKVNDGITFLDLESSEILGKRTIKSVEKFDSHVEVKLDCGIEMIPDLPAIRAVINDIYSVNSVIKNCDFRGDFNLRTPLYVKESKFCVRNIRTQSSILFSNCQLDFEIAEDDEIDIEQLEGVVFSDCEIKKNILS